MGLIEALDAFAMVAKKVKDALLLVGGRGPMRQTLEARAAELMKSGNVRFLDFIPNPELHLYYQAADLCLMPSKDLEGFGLVTVEAMACGTPVLGTRHGGTVEIIEQFDGAFLTDADVVKMAGAIIELLSKPAELAAAREKCRKFVETTYPWDRAVSLLEEAFRSAADARQE
jgi:glycosyltransferase involved in cell wall biosynthesis